MNFTINAMHHLVDSIQMVSRCNQLIYFFCRVKQGLYICVLLIINTKNMADKIKKNLLGRNVTVQRKTMSDGSLAKTRTVTSKNGGTISSKTSYKDAGSLAGKMKAAKDNRGAKKDIRQTTRNIKQIRKTYGKIAQQGGDITNASSPEGRAFKKAAMEGAKMGMSKTSLSTKRGMNNAIKRNASLNASEEMAQLGSQVSQSAARGAMNSGKVVQRVKQDSKPIMKKAVKEGPVKRIGLKVTKK